MKNKKALNIISQLEKLINLNNVEFENLNETLQIFNYQPIKNFYLSLQIGAKPEDATSKLLHTILLDILNKKNVFTEIRLESGGFADFRIQETKNIPMQIEIKPLYKRNPKKQN